ncbi:MAG TPA: hypothetical protein VK614_04065 [Allosphingosinicella sp.]|nr:hypothetical protein [Allosphingosinicella sp.]
MRRVLIPSLALGFLISAASPAAAVASYETEEIAILRTVVAQARRLAGGPVCIDLHLRGQLPNAATLARRWVRDARRARAPGFERIERALGSHGGRAATADRDLDGRELAGANGISGPVVERCPAQEWFSFSRPVLSRGAAVIEAAVGSDCSAGWIFVALGQRGRRWVVEGEYSVTVPGGLGCGQAYPAQQAAAGHYLVMGE